MKKSEQDSGRKRLFDSFVVRLAAGISIFFASAGIIGLLSLNILIKRGEKVEVPNVVNKSVVEALDILSERKLELRKAGAQNSAVIAENYILSQDPIPGTIVKDGTPVSVVISLGSQVSVVPDLVGLSLREARVELNRAGLIVGRSSKIHYGGEKDVVLGQSPTPDEYANRETPVDLLLSLGPRPREYRLPIFIGHPMDRVSSMLDSMGLVIGEVTTKLDLMHPEGIVLDQDPSPGSLVEEGSLVSLVMGTWHDEEETAERKYVALLYQVPYGFWPKSVKIEVSDPDGVRTIYEEVDEPGATIRLVFGYWAQCTVRVFLADNLELERTFR
jgi:serine/threonine-protein kinase